MAQNDIQITTTPPLPGLTLVQGINGALQSLATDFAGSIDPAAIDGVGPYCTWADTGNGLLKRRNAAGTDWVVEGTLFKASLPQYLEADIPLTDKGPIYVIGKGNYEWSAGTSQYSLAAVPDGSVTEGKLSASLLSSLQWLGVPVGQEFHLDPDAPLPPTDNPNFRYVVLTAGQSGAGGYNEGVLTSETVSGSDPVITATAVVSLAGSPLFNKTIDLLNTSRTFVRPGVGGDAIVASQNRSHSHTAVQRSSTANGSAPYPAIGNGAIGPGSIELTANGGVEANPRYIPRTYLMRIM